MANVKPLRVGSMALGRDLTLGAMLAELFGVFVLTTAVLVLQGNPIVAALTVLILVLMIGGLSGAHVNPAVTVGMWATRQISWQKAVGYLVAQILGAMLALVIVTNFLHGTMVTDQLTGSPTEAKVFKVTAASDYAKPFFAEAVGALIFGFGVASAWIGKKERGSFEYAFTVGGALLVGLFIATIGSSAVINPAVALGVGAYQSDKHMMWSFIAYGLAPLLGATIGMWLYRIMQTEDEVLVETATAEKSKTSSKKR